MSDRRRLLLSLAALAAVYAALIWAGDTRAWSGSDAGGKVATIRHMVDADTTRPEVGYWAERWDPDGEHHPLVYTVRQDDRWVQVTSLPFVYLGLPLYRLAGTAGLLVVPALGSLLAAYGARRLARALGAERGWGAFWLVGLGTPMLFYAGDFWEHSAAVGLAVLALAVALEGGAGRALAAGVLAGLAAVLRTEVLLYAGVTGAALLFVADERRAWLRAPARVVALAVGAAVPLVGNALVERAVLGGGLRDARAGDSVSAAGQELGTRLSDGALTAMGLFAEDTGRAFVAGGLVVVSLVLVSLGLRSRWAGWAGWRFGAAGAAALYLARFAQGLGFVPGTIPTAPAAAAATGAENCRQRAVAVAAVATLPAVWLLSWRGQLIPQWGGRYVLMTGALLTVVGAVVLERGGWRRPPALALLALTTAVAIFGAVWHVDRTRDVAGAFAELHEVPDDVVIVSGIGHLAREGGAFYGERRWLTVLDDDLDSAAGVARRAGVRRIDLVVIDRDEVSLEGWRADSRRTVDFLGFPLEVTRYVR